MEIKINLLDDFSCIGGKCQSTCCQGWDISIDEAAYEKYLAITDDYGKELRNNIIREDNNHVKMKMDDKKCCPCLNKEGLCELFIQCGEEYLCFTCASYPRSIRRMDGYRVMFLFLSCEEVLRAIWRRKQPVKLELNDFKRTGDPMDDFLYCLYEVINMGQSFLQDEEYNFASAISALAYMADEFCDTFVSLNYSGVKQCFGSFPNIYLEFENTRNCLTKQELEEGATQFIFYAVDSFCRVLREEDFDFMSNLFWPENVYDLDGKDRKEFVEMAIKRAKKYLRDNISFYRGMVAAQFANAFSELLELEKGMSKKVFLDRFCYYILLFCVLPFTWGMEVDTLEDFLPRISYLGRAFFHTDVISKKVIPILDELAHPDAISYAMSFLYLWQEDFC